MATSATKLDAGELKEQIASQFRGLNPNDPASWPLVPKLALCLAVTVAIVVALWFAWLTNSADELTQEQQREQTLRQDYTKKLTQAVNLDALRKQREEVQTYVTQLEKQLPSKAEMDALLSDINQAGLGRSLTFDLFRPGQVSVKEYYAELPIAVRVSGRYVCDNWEVLREWALAGLGVALKSTWDVRRHLEDGSLVSLLSGYSFHSDVAIWAVYPHRRHLPAKTRAFIDFLAASFGPEPYWDKPRSIKPRIRARNSRNSGSVS